jgi:hypothetical protein
MVPSQFHRRQLAANAVFIGRLHRSGSNIEMRFRTAGLDRQRCFEFQSPARQVDKVAAEVRHRAVSKIPPAVPFWTGEIIIVEWAGRCRAQPKIPIEALRYRVRFLWCANHDEAIFGFAGSLLTFAPSPGTRTPHVNVANHADRP